MKTSIFLTADKVEIDTSKRMVASLTYTGGLEEDIEMDIQVGEDRKWEVMRSCNW